MDLRQLRLFVAVAEELNFTRAAERVNLSQPALSQQIRGLEDDLGVPLFLRTARGALLTPAGEVLLDEARRLLETAAHIVRRVRRTGGLDDQAVRVGFDFVELGSVPPLPSLLTAFRTQFPEASVEIQVLPSDQLEQALLDDRLDIAFAFGGLSSSKLSFHPLLEGHYEALLPQQHPLTHGERLSAVQLVSERLLLPQLSVTAGQTLLLALSPAGQSLRVVYRGTGVAAFAGLVAAGEGIALLPAPLTSAALRPGLLARPLQHGPLWSFGLVWRKDRPPSMTEVGVRLIRQLVPRPVSC
ncbi:LysR family transcriptional regulator [Deinococcus sp. Arct2-2]|uniref:LysR family transcriptional regulator n=1 Tax=Deinococcus sp. Arct2-2 TaxID=2568653 RepID=UPI0010A416F2|nr:LysR substrate-binding domain-containing protein [Deinococcus sp. Arct2-2]THF70316.1 LysR family transcriptional regulator [Deinococcus sp. Arct2-2]